MTLLGFHKHSVDVADMPLQPELKSSYAPDHEERLMLIQSNRSALPLHRAFAKSSKQASPGVSMRIGTDKIYVSQNSLAVLI